MDGRAAGRGSGTWGGYQLNPRATGYPVQVIPSGAQLLAQARISRNRLSQLPEAARPRNAEEAYVCQEILVRQLLEHYGGSVIGYKVACTNTIAQQQLHVDGPFYGHLLEAFCFESPAQVPPDQFVERVIEAEFAFRMARDLPPSAGTRSVEEVADAVGAVLPGIEIVDARFDSWTTVGAPSLIADNACNAAWVRGQLRENWREFDLAGQAVRLTVNGQVSREGSGRAVLGHPLNALQWLVNTLSSRGLGLRAGQFVTTGVTTEVYWAQRGDRITADFGAVGTAELTFE